MSNLTNDETNDILKDHIEAITKLNPEQLRVYNDVCNVLFDDFMKNKGDTNE